MNPRRRIGSLFSLLSRLSAFSHLANLVSRGAADLRVVLRPLTSFVSFVSLVVASFSLGAETLRADPALHLDAPSVDAARSSPQNPSLMDLYVWGAIRHADYYKGFEGRPESVSEYLFLTPDLEAYVDHGHHVSVVCGFTKSGIKVGCGYAKIKRPAATPAPLPPPLPVPVVLSPYWSEVALGVGEDGANLSDKGGTKKHSETVGGFRARAGGDIVGRYGFEAVVQTWNVPSVAGKDASGARPVSVSHFEGAAIGTFRLLGSPQGEASTIKKGTVLRVGLGLGIRNNPSLDSLSYFPSGNQYQSFSTLYPEVAVRFAYGVAKSVFTVEACLGAIAIHHYTYVGSTISVGAERLVGGGLYATALLGDHRYRYAGPAEQSKTATDDILMGVKYRFGK